MFNIIHELVDVQTDVIRTGDSRTRGSNRVSADECGAQTVDAYSSVGLAIVV
jgi:hypothetical protein